MSLKKTNAFKSKAVQLALTRAMSCKRVVGDLL